MDLAYSAGLVLDPWEVFELTEALGERDDGKWAAFEVGLIVSRQNGKGSILEARELGGLFLFGEELLLHTAHEFKTAQEAFRRVRRLIESTPDLDAQVLKIPESHGEEGIELKATPTIILPDGSKRQGWPIRRLRFIARSGGSGRGFTGDLLIYDEAMILEAASVGASLPALSARPNSQVWYTGSAGLKVRGALISTQLARVRRRGVAASEGKPPDPSLMFAEWSIDPHTDDCDPSCTTHDLPYAISSYQRANPALGVMRYRIEHAAAACDCQGLRDVPCRGRRAPAGVGLTVEAIEREAAAMDAETFGNERLGVGFYPADADGWSVIPKAWWERTIERDAPYPARPCFGIDSTPDRSMSAIGVAGAHRDGRRYVEVVDHQSGLNWLVQRAVAVDRRWGPAKWVIDKRSAAGAVIGKLEEAGLAVETPNATEVGHACGQLYDAFRDDELRHADDRDISRALAGAATRKLSDQWAWDRVNSSVDICPLCAVTLAHWGHLKFGDAGNYDAAGSVHFDLNEIVRLCTMGAYGPDDIARIYSAGILDAAALTELAHRGVAIPAGLT